MKNIIFLYHIMQNSFVPSSCRCRSLPFTLRHVQSGNLSKMSCQARQQAKMWCCAGDKTRIHIGEGFLRLLPYSYRITFLIISYLAKCKVFMRRRQGNEWRIRAWIDFQPWKYFLIIKVINTISAQPSITHSRSYHLDITSLTTSCICICIVYQARVQWKRR